VNNFLSKSDFKTARDCATKLFYKKKHYPNKLDDDPYMELLADGGFMVGKYAQLQRPEGVMISELDPVKAVAETAARMAAGNVTLFEPAFLAGGCLARIDVLEKEGDHIRLIEVKSKGFDDREGIATKSGGVRAEWVEYIEDVAFQRMVVERMYPRATIECFLLVPDKRALSEIDLLPTLFRITRNGRLVEVEFTGDPASVQASKLLRLVSVDREVAQVYPEVCQIAGKLLPLVVDGPSRAEPILGYKCRDCEFRVVVATGGTGFSECWGKLGEVNPSILDLYQLSRIKGPDKSVLADSMIRAGKVSLFDIPLSSLTTSYGNRQRIQIENTKDGTEWRSPGFIAPLAGLPYPLHFVDFETSRLVLPYHRGMRPFEQIAFQWSCHTLETPDGPLRQSEWINVEETYPNVKFVAALRDTVGKEGTILTWSHHEKTTLNDIARQIGEYGIEAGDLRVWLEATAQSGRLFDMCAHTLEHFFLPEMKGSTSIKAVLPAIWRSNAALRDHPWFKQYARTDNGIIADPYHTLPKMEIFENAEVVEEGTGAMRAYQEMLYGSGRHDPSVRATWRELLLQYCRLDTLAMVIIWTHWIGGG
jgi:hypothetical protein